MAGGCPLKYNNSKQQPLYTGMVWYGDGDGDGVKGTTRVQRPERYQFDVDEAACSLPRAQDKVIVLVQLCI